MTLATVICNQTEASWEKVPESISLTNSADIWRIPVVSDPKLFSALETFLLPEEFDKSLRFRQLKDKYRFIIRKAALRIILSQYLGITETEIQFFIGENKKPCVRSTNEIQLHYNVSHSGDWILIAVSNSELGVDIEQINTGFDHAAVILESFSKDESDYIQNEADPERSFFRLWTRKEALTKATSKGLDDDFVDIPCLDGEHMVSSCLLRSEKNWVISSFEVEKGYTGSVAFHPSKPLHFFDFKLIRKKL